jgi:hypothetical protein
LAPGIRGLQVEDDAKVQVEVFWVVTPCEDPVKTLHGVNNPEDMNFNLKTSKLATNKVRYVTKENMYLGRHFQVLQIFV